MHIAIAGNIGSGKTTLTTLLFIENIAIIGHVGDSRIYLLRGNEFKQITIDHTWVEGEVK